MAKFKVTRKQVPYSGGLKTSYTATLVKNREVSAEEFSEVLTKKTRVNPIDCLKLLMTVADEISSGLSEGNIVRVGHLGSFRISIKSGTADNPDAITPESLGIPKIVFTPSKEMKRKLEEIRYEKM